MSDKDKNYNNALAHTIATSEYRAAVHAMSTTTAMLDEKQYEKMCTRIEQLKNALTYELFEVFGVVAEGQDLIMMPLVAFHPTTQQALDNSYQLALDGGEDDTYPWFAKVVKIRRDNPHTAASYSLVHYSLGKIQDLVRDLEEYHLDGDVNKANQVIEVMLSYINIIAMGPDSYETIKIALLMSEKLDEDNVMRLFATHFLDGIPKQILAKVIGEEAADAAIEAEKKKRCH